MYVVAPNRDIVLDSRESEPVVAVGGRPSLRDNATIGSIHRADDVIITEEPHTVVLIQPDGLAPICGSRRNGCDVKAMPIVDPV